MLGAGPGGYSAAFRAADLGLKVILVERYAHAIDIGKTIHPHPALAEPIGMAAEVAHEPKDEEYFVGPTQ